MVNFWWTCSRSFRRCVQSWQVLDGHLCHLLLMMSLNCPLAIRHKKEEYIWMEIGGDFFFFVLELWSFRLYLGALHYTYFLAHDIFIFMSFFFFFLIVYDKGRHYVLISVSCFTLCYIDH